MAKKKYSGGNQKSNGIISLIILLIVIASVAYVALFGVNSVGTGSIADVKLGLDLAGGVSITYQATEANPSATDMNDTIYKLRRRADSYSTEAEVYQEGSNRINVDIPGAKDAEAILQELGQPGSLEFKTPDGEVILTGKDVKDARAGFVKENGNTKYVVDLQFYDDAAAIFAETTETYLNQRISIVYDGEVISSPEVQSKITGGTCQITGMASYEDAEVLATTIRIGALPLELTELHSKVIGAKLGQEAINTSLIAGAIGFGIIVLFMIAIYLIPGLASALALTLYIGLTIILLNVFDVTLTLPGIAGIVLSIGMAVDANVIIFARIREEIAAGKTVRSAIKEGFSKALSAIIDGNITTLIAAVILLWKGSGPVKGFALTLALGIVLSMFTALVITRFALNALYNLGVTDAKFYGKAREVKKINFLGKKNIFLACSLAVIVVGFVFLGINKANDDLGTVLNYSLDFKGGTSTNVTFNEDMSIESLNEDVIPVIREVIGEKEAVETQKVSGENSVIFKTRTLNGDERTALAKALEEKFSVDTDLITTESVSATVSSEMKKDAVIAVIVATIGMLIYIWFRFKDIKFAASAVAALLHDVLVVLAFYAVTKWAVGNTFIACMLTIVGYSINATIVIFDRIRENMAKMTKKDDLADIVNTSISQTLSRSINTSLTTFIMVFALFILGVTSVREFCLPLIVGIVCGAYSSVCITGALWYIMKTKLVKKA